ncbi:unnamed protein product [Blepharisma stoltei]|uniref:RBR-type E3 ubiquitin transferase n=1 Tax=Blepharisma stoltei TaxID=1481888 RepID=A0AAU9K1X9_9CILI|nr:unnamed protein product [Blepharisma stoltei]
MSNEYESIPDQNVDELFTCPICYQETMENSEIEGCRHTFCTECLKAFLADKISCAKVTQITCPNDKCGTVLKRSFLETIVPPEILEKYDKFKKREELSQNPLLKFCPEPDCEGYDVGGHKKNKLTCSICKKNFCFTCNEPWHGKERCKNKTNVEFEKYVREKNVKFCPKCGKRVEKQGGCSHMTCICGFIWCWRCGRNPFTRYHGVKCYFGNSLAEMRWIVILGMLLSPILAPISALIILVLFFSSSDANRTGKLYKYRIWLYLMLLFLSIPVEIVVMAIIIFLLIDDKWRHFSPKQIVRTLIGISATLIAIIGVCILYPLFLLMLALGPIFGLICLSLKLCSLCKMQKPEENNSNYPHDFI